MKTLTRATISNSTAKEVGITKQLSHSLLEGLLNEIIDELTRGKSIKISSFGSFRIRQKRSRIGRNPKTGIEAPICARKVVTFRASPILKKKTAHGDM